MMRKSLRIRAISTGFLLLVFSCFVVFASGEKEEQKGEAAKTTIKAMVPMDFSNQSASRPESAEAIDKIWTKFQADNPEIDLQIQIFKGGADDMQKLMAAETAGTMPDCGNVAGMWLATFRDAGMLTPINELWSEEDRKDFLPITTTHFKKDGKLYSIWWYTSPRSLYFRNDFLKDAGYENPPQSWEEIVTIGKKLTNDQRWGFVFPSGRGTFSAIILYEFLTGFGGDWIDATGRPSFHEGKNCEYLKEIFQFQHDLVNKYKISPPGVVTMRDDDITPLIFADEAAMWITSSSTLKTILDYRPEFMETIGTDFAPMPEKLGRPAGTYTGGYQWVIFTKDPAKVKLAWKFVETMNNAKNLAAITAAQWKVPTRKSALDSAPLFRENPFFKSFFHQMEVSGIMTPPVPYYPTIANEVSQAAQEVIQQKVGIDEAISRAGRASIEEWERWKKESK
jgi:multiple sugar transport system substrate-binding protein